MTCCGELTTFKRVLDRRKRGDSPLQVRDELLAQVEEFKYFGVLFMVEERGEWEIDRWIDAEIK